MRKRAASTENATVRESGELSDSRAKSVIQSVLRRRGYQISKLYPKDFEPETIELIERVGPFTMTSPERIVATVSATEYVARHEIPGALVECGVWRGGSMMAIALTLQRLGKADRDLYLFDTFEGMSEPTEHDVTRQGMSAEPVWRQSQEGNSNVWCRATIDEVREAVLSTGYDEALVHMVKGKVEDTLPENAPGEIALLRLDTDFYESTRAELIHLYPRLRTGGVLIFDDYGGWEGARKAADEYFAANDVRILLDRTDSTGRIAVKQD